MEPKYKMSADQRNRRRKALLMGIPLAAISAFLGAGLTGSFKAMVFASFSAAIIISIVIWVITKLVFTHKESKTRGAWYGVLGGCFALYLAITATLLFGWYFKLDGPNPDPDSSLFVFSNPLSIPLIATFYTIFAFIFGGFLGPVLGGAIGYALSRDISQNEVIAETFD